MEVPNTVIIDAAARFAERQRDAEEQTKSLALSEELVMVRDCIAEQPARFFAFLSLCSSKVADELQVDFGTNMQAKLVLDSENSPDKSIISGVYYRENALGDKNPHLFITDKDVSTMGKLLDPLVSIYSDQQTDKVRLRLATSAICWMSLGAWAFDRLDPRRNGEIDTSPESYAFWSELVGLTSLENDENNPEVQALIQQHAEILKLRIAGSCAYYGIIEAGLATEIGVKAFQRLYFTPHFARQVDNNPESILPEHFALANPLTDNQVEEMFVRLGLVQ